jgi:hypothetical protein
LINKIVAIGLVHGLKNFSADFRQDPDFHVFVFEIHNLVSLVSLRGRQVVVGGVRIDAMLRALGNSAKVKLRVGVGRADEIRGDGDLFFPNFYRYGRSGGKQRAEYPQAEQERKK